MIKNDKQYQVTKSRLKDFKLALQDIADDNSLLAKIEHDSLKSQILQFEQELKAYEAMKKGDVTIVHLESLTDIYKALINARIIKGWTQAELADQLDLKEQQIQRYELSDYSTASIARINEVASALEINIAPIKVKVKEPTFRLNQEIDPDKLLQIRSTKRLLQV